ncbi:MAG: ATP-binding protein [Actinomycetota bacterium]|nr:ATP-binding protein [Actinomycetota bacterium]
MSGHQNTAETLAFGEQIGIQFDRLKRWVDVGCGIIASWALGTGWTIVGLAAVAAWLAVGLVIWPTDELPARLPLAPAAAVLVLWVCMDGPHQLIDPIEDASMLSMLVVLGLVGRVVERSLRVRFEAAQQELHMLRDRIVSVEEVNRANLGIAHDLRNVFTVVKASAADLAEEMRGRRAGTLVTEILNATERGLSITDDLAVVGRGDPESLSPLNLCHLTNQLEPLLRRLVNPTVQVEVTSDASPVFARVDRSGVLHVLMNLVVNAGEAMGGCGTVRVECTRGTRQVQGLPGEQPTARLRVIDSGTGMPPEVVRRIFDPGFSTKGGPQRGLGMVVVQQVVQRCHGWVEVETSPRQGTTFTVEFPLAEPHRALVVIGDDGSRRLLVEELRAAEFEVIETPCPLEACDLVASGRRPDVALLDESFADDLGLRQVARLDRVERTMLFGASIGRYTLPSTRADAADLLRWLLGDSLQPQPDPLSPL